MPPICSSFFAKQFAKMFGCLPKDYRGHSL